MKDTIKGLHFLHSHGLYHHDINPRNIIFQEDSGNYMLTDYGFVRKFTTRGTRKTFLKGDSEIYRKSNKFHKLFDLYSSPEVLKAKMEHHL